MPISWRLMSESYTFRARSRCCYADYNPVCRKLYVQTQLPLERRKTTYMKKIILGASLAVLTAFGAVALNAAGHDPIEQRIALMKANGADAGVLGKMVQGETTFDADAALAAITDMRDIAAQFGDLFPEGSETGPNSTANATIWSDRAGFDAAVAKYLADTQAGVDAAPQSLDELGATFGAIASNCRACHQEYRIPR